MTTSAPTCACHAALLAAHEAREALRATATRRKPRVTGKLLVDRATLRRALGGRDEIAEAMEAKATGRPGANVSRLWAFLTASLYTSGDLPVLSVREMAQNAVDAVRAAIRARKLRTGEGRIEVSWDPDRRAITVSDNGIGMDARTVLDVFLSLGSTGKAEAGDSEQAAGGFGVAKAVILGASQSFTWEVHTRDNLAVSRGVDTEVQVYDAPARAGTRITIFDVSPEYDLAWDYARQEYVPLVDRLRELLAANDLPGITLVLDGEEVRPMFSRRGGSRVRVEGSWGRGTDAAIKAYRRPPGDRHGAYYVRLGGLFQFKESARRGNLKADVVVDLTTSIRPGDPGYPLNAARDALQSRASWAFKDLVEEVERENESVGRDQSDEVFDPDSDDAEERRGASEIADLAAEAFADEAFQRALAEAAGGIADYYAERAKAPGVEAPVASLAPAGTRARPSEDQPTRGAVLPPGLVVAQAAAPVEADIAAPSDGAGAARQLRAVLQAAQQLAEDGGGHDPVIILSADVARVLDRAEAGAVLDEAEVVTLQRALDAAAGTAMLPTGGGLLQAATVSHTGAHALGAFAVDEGGERRRRERRNPFGRLAGLRISRKNYDRRRAWRFKRNFQRWMPHLTAWDATLRLVVAEARIRRSFKPGFVLDDELLGLTTTSAAGRAVVYIHPDRLEQVVKAHKYRPLAIAAYLHGIACHELAHLDGRMGRGHDESFVAAREDLGHATGHLLPAIAVLVQNVLGLPVRPSDEQKRIAHLERQLERVREKAAGSRKAQAEVARLQRELDGARAALEEALAESARVRAACGRACGTCGCEGGAEDPAARVVEAAVSALLTQPPAGVVPAEVASFARRHRERLVGLVRARMGVATGARP